MIIERIQVQEGFLDGLDLDFSAGLNVLIGPRGTGKTSIIELLRFCLQLPAYSDKIASRSQQHASSILGSGAVTVTCRVGQQQFDVTRSAGSTTAVPLPVSRSAIVLSQGEIEIIGLDVRGKLRLLDSFRDTSDDALQDATLLASIRSIGAEVRDAVRAIQDIDDQLIQLAGTDVQLTALRAEQGKLLKAAGGTEQQQQALHNISDRLANQSTRLEALTAVNEAVDRLMSRLSAANSAAAQAVDEARMAKGFLGPIRTQLDEVSTGIARDESLLQQAQDALKALWEKATHERLRLDDEARTLRQVLDKAKQGAGQLAQRITILEQEQRRAVSLALGRGRRAVTLEALQKKRQEMLTRLDTIRLGRFAARKATAQNLSRLLAPSIRVSVEHLGDMSEYGSAIVSMLKGSGLHYSSLAPRLATALTPRELATAIENGRADIIASAAGIDETRAGRLIGQGQRTGTEDLLASEVDDTVSIGLLVGSDYRPSEQLSVGQRCTAILPVLLAAQSKLLVIDQPEDNLDNAFIVGTVIQSIRERPPMSSQLICATHNPNIPVLGNAQRVVLMDSDGSRGFVRNAGQLDDAGSIDAISTVMEGGREAFQRRAEFYGV